MNGNGVVTFDEFLVYFKHQHPETEEEIDSLIEWEFDMIDTDGSGELDITEVEACMKRLGMKTRGILGGTDKLKNVFQEMKGSGKGGRVKLEEFRKWYKKPKSEEKSLARWLSQSEPKNQNLYAIASKKS